MSTTEDDKELWRNLLFYSVFNSWQKCYMRLITILYYEFKKYESRVLEEVSQVILASME